MTLRMPFVFDRPVLSRGRARMRPAVSSRILVLAWASLLLAGSCIGQSVVGAVVQPSETGVALPSGATTYIYAMATGGALPSSSFSQGQSQTLVDADSVQVAAMAVTTGAANQFSTAANYYTAAGVAVSGDTNLAQFYGSNNSPGASTASDSFVVAQPSLVVVVATAGGEASLTLSGVPGLEIAAQSGDTGGGVIPIVIGQASLAPGAYTVVENSAPSPAGGQDPNHMGDLLGVFVFATAGGAAPPGSPGGVVSPVALSGPTSSTLTLVSGEIDGQAVSPTSRTVNVQPGDPVAGSFTVAISSNWYPADVMAMGVTPTWGDPAASFTDLGGFANPSSDLQRTISLNLTAPSTPGTYYIIAAYGATFTASQVMSGTNWSAGAAEGQGAGFADWETGDAIADWAQSTIDLADAYGAAWTECLASVGPNETPPVQNQPCYTPATAVEVVVGSGVAPNTFVPPATSVSTEAPLAPLMIELQSDSADSNYLLFSDSDVSAIERSVEGSIQVPAGEAPLVGVADYMTPSPLQLLIALTGGDDFVEFQNFAAYENVAGIACENVSCEQGTNQVAYAVPPGGALVLLFPDVDVPSATVATLSIAGGFGLVDCSISCGSLKTSADSYESKNSSPPDSFSTSGDVNFGQPGSSTDLTDSALQSDDVTLEAYVGDPLSDAAQATSANGTTATATSTNSTGGFVQASVEAGNGTISAGQYLSTNPATGLEASCQPSSSECAPAYFDVSVDSEATGGVSQVYVEECLTPSGSGTPAVSWWNPNRSWFSGPGWEPITSGGVQAYGTAIAQVGTDPYTYFQCVHFLVTTTTTPSLSDLVGTYFRVESPPSGVQLVTSLQSLTVDRGTGDYIAQVRVTNDGAATAGSVALTTGTLGGSEPGSSLPIALGDLASGASATAFLSFPASTGSPGARTVLQVGESYQGGTAGGGFRVALPQ